MQILEINDLQSRFNGVNSYVLPCQNMLKIIAGTVIAVVVCFVMGMLLR